MKTIFKTSVTHLLASVVLLSIAPAVFAQSVVHVKLHNREVRCIEDIVRVKDVADIQTRDTRLAREIETLDLDSFNDYPRVEGAHPSIGVTKSQVRFRLILAGLKADQIKISGPDRLTVMRIETAGLSHVVVQRLQQQLTEQYLMSVSDFKVTVDRRFSKLENAGFDFATLTLSPTFETELPLGNQQIAALVEDGSGKLAEVKIPVSIALIRDLVVAKHNISKGETLSMENVESVRRPVVSRNVRFASFEQVLGKQAQSDVQQYDLIKTNAVRTASNRSAFAVKKNALVSIVVRRGALTVVLKEAKAMDNGNPGDQIRFVNQKTREQIFARIIDSTTAEVRF